MEQISRENQGPANPKTDDLKETLHTLPLQKGLPTVRMPFPASAQQISTNPQSAQLLEQMKPKVR